MPTKNENNMRSDLQEILKRITFLQIIILAIDVVFLKGLIISSGVGVGIIFTTAITIVLYAIISIVNRNTNKPVSEVGFETNDAKYDDIKNIIIEYRLERALAINSGVTIAFILNAPMLGVWYNIRTSEPVLICVAITLLLITSVLIIRMLNIRYGIKKCTLYSKGILFYRQIRIDKITKIIETNGIRGSTLTDYMPRVSYRKRRIIVFSDGEIEIGFDDMESSQKLKSIIEEYTGIKYKDEYSKVLEILTE